MRFGKTLRNSTYEPWKLQYIDYKKLKKLLREDGPSGKDGDWTEDDESKFVEELMNVQLEQVNAFHEETYKQLRDRTSACEARLGKSETTANTAVQDVAQTEKAERGSDEKETLTDILKELDNITKEINELEKYSRINFTGFLKAAKKHDRRRGSRYKVRPILQVRLAALPFNSEDYSPLLYRFVIVLF